MKIDNKNPKYIYVFNDIKLINFITLYERGT